MDINIKSPPKYLAYYESYRVSSPVQPIHNSGISHQSRERKAVPKTGHGCPKIACLKILIEVLSLHGRVHVRPDERYRAPRNPSPLIGNLNGDVFLALDDDDLDGREVVFTVWTVPFNDGPQRVFEKLKADVGQVARNVAEMEVLRANQLNRGTFKHPKIQETSQGLWNWVQVRGRLPVMFLTYVSRILN